MPTEDMTFYAVFEEEKQPEIKPDISIRNFVNSRTVDYRTTISRFEEQYKTSQETIKEKDNVIESLREEYKNYISERDATIEYQAAIIIDKDDKNIALQDELNRYKNKEQVEQKKKQRQKKRILFIWNIFWKLSLLFGVAYFAFFLNKKLDFKPLSYLVGVVDVVGVILVILQIIKKSKEKYLN